jgi:hypothetical protein
MFGWKLIVSFASASTLAYWSLVSRVLNHNPSLPVFAVSPAAQNQLTNCLEILRHFKMTLPMVFQVLQDGKVPNNQIV